MMNTKKRIILTALICGLTFATQFRVQAQLEVSALQAKITGSKVLVTLKMSNSFNEAIQSAKATVFLCDEKNQAVGHSTKWVIGDGKKLAGLAVGGETTFNFVIPLATPIAITNLQSKVTFDRLVMSDGKVVAVNKNVKIAQ